MADVTMAEDSHVQDEEMEEDSEENSDEPKKPSILDNFTALQHVTEETDRVNKTMQILRKLHGSEDENQLTYALNRLIRGLAGSRTVPKKNFYVALTQLLRITSSVEVSRVFEIMKKELHAVGSNSKSENADIHFGEILLCGSLIRSGMFVKATPEEQQQILEILLKAGKKRHYLSLAAYKFIIETLDQVDEKQFKTMWKIMEPHLEDGDSVDHLYFLLKVQEKFRKLIDPYLKRKRGSKNLFTDENVKEVMEKLLARPWLVKCEHPVYTSIGQEIITFGVKKWCNVMDEFMKKGHSAMHEILTIVITDLLQRLDDTSLIPELFTPNYLLFTFNSYRSNDWREESFVKVMQALFKTLEEKIQLKETSTDIKIQILAKFLHFPGDIRFDSLTRSKIVNVTTNSLDTEGVKALVKLYKDILLVKTEVGNEGRSSFSQQDRSFAAVSMVKLLKHQSLLKEKEYKMKMIKFLLKLVFLKEEKFSNVSNNLANVIRPHFFSILDQKFGKLEDLRDVLLDLIEHMNKKISTNPESLRNHLSEEELAVWNEMIAFSDSLKSSGKDSTDKLIVVFQVLCLQMGFQIFRDFKLADTSLKDIVNCYEEQSKQLDKKKKRKKIAAEEESVTWIEVVVDLFLNFLSLESHLLRNVVNCVFPHLCPYLNKESLKQILDALFSDDENPLSEESGSEDEDDGESSDEEEGAESSSDDDDAEDDEAEPDDKLQPLRMACSKALAMDGNTSDAESIDVDDISEEDGRKIDEMLAECFRNFKPKTNKELKQAEKKEHTKIATFRSRVLDLLGIYLETDPSLSVCVDLVPYLMHATFWSIKNDNFGLTNRLRHVLSRLSKLKKARLIEDVSIEDVTSAWKNLYQKNEDLSANLLRSAMDEIVTASIFVLRSAQMVQNGCETEEAKTRVEDSMYEAVSETLHTFLDDNDIFVTVFLTKLFDFSYSYCAKIVSVLVRYSFNPENNWFKRCRVFKLVSSFYLSNRLVGVQYEAHPKAMKENWKQLSRESLKMLQETDTSEENTNSRQKFLEIMFVMFAKLKNGPHREHFEKFDWVTFVSTAEVCFNKETNKKKETKYAFRQLCAALRLNEKCATPNVQVKDEEVKEEFINGTIAGSSKKQKKNKLLVKKEEVEEVKPVLVNGTNKESKRAKKRKSIAFPVAHHTSEEELVLKKQKKQNGSIEESNGIETNVSHTLGKKKQRRNKNKNKINATL